jgi:hypothetical protein
VKRKAKMFLSKAFDSLITSIECFNKISDVGRQTSVLILLNHAFEMLIKASIIARDGTIIDKGEDTSYSFDKCLRIAHTTNSVKFLSEEQVLFLQTLNALRDSAHHYLIDISEQLLYLQAQGSITLFQDILKSIFDINLQDKLPSRVLPISTLPPLDLISIFENDINQIKGLLASGKRKSIQAMAKLSSLIIVENALNGKTGQPRIKDLRKVSKQLKQGVNWTDIFQGVSSINISPNEGSNVFNLRITRSQGIPVTIVPEGTKNATVIAIRKVNDTDYYSLGRNGLAEKCGVTTSKMSALIWHLKLKEDPECFKQIKIGKSVFERYSPKGLDELKKELEKVNLDEIWSKYKNRNV